MNRDEALEHYLEICKRTYEHLERTNAWPWLSDSTDTKNMIDSDSNSESI